MLNFYYMYAVVWGVILILYSFGWSDLCAPLAPELATFFFVTISLSILLGFINRKKFAFHFVKELPRRNRTVTWLIVCFCLLEFAYCRQIPLLYIITHRGGYTEYTGIPTLHPLVITFGAFYAQYLFYRFLCDRSEKSALKEYCLILFFIYLLQFNRGGLLLAVSMSLLLYLGMNEKRIFGSKKGKRYLVAAAMVVVVAMFAFGALGNVRHGYSMADSSYIQGLGKFNDRYPSWLPKQFMWAYIYIVSPVANINYNLTLYAAQSNIPGFIMTLFPDFIVRRIFSGEIYAPYLVMEHVFNATAGFGTAYRNAGTVGMYILYFYMMFGLMFLWSFVPVRREFKMPCLAIMNVIVIFMFFTHTINYSAISFPLVFPLLSFIRFTFGTQVSLEMKG